MYNNTVCADRLMVLTVINESSQTTLECALQCGDCGAKKTVKFQKHIIRSKRSKKSLLLTIIPILPSLHNQTHSKVEEWGELASQAQDML